MKQFSIHHSSPHRSLSSSLPGRRMLLSCFWGFSVARNSKYLWLFKKIILEIASVLRPWGWKCQVLPKRNTWQPSVALCDGRQTWGKRSQAPRVEGPPAISESESGRGAVPWLLAAAGANVCPSQAAAHTQIWLADGNMERWAGKEQKRLPGRKKRDSWRRTKAEGDPTSLNVSCFLLSSLLFATGV